MSEMGWRFALERLKVLAEQVPECVAAYRKRDDAKQEGLPAEERLAVSCFESAAKWVVKATERQSQSEAVENNGVIVC